MSRWSPTFSFSFALSPKHHFGSSILSLRPLAAVPKAGNNERCKKTQAGTRGDDIPKKAILSVWEVWQKAGGEKVSVFERNLLSGS
jgi:hypothetical protein